MKIYKMIMVQVRHKSMKPTSSKSSVSPKIEKKFYKVCNQHSPFLSFYSMMKCITKWCFLVNVFYQEKSQKNS